MPETLPAAALSREQLLAWRGCTYTQLCFEVLRLFVPANEMGDADLRGVVTAAFVSFGSPETVRA